MEATEPGEHADIPVIPTNWVITNKGDREHVDIRARLVACEVKGAAASEAMYFSATPPLDALKCIISLAACDATKKLDFIDVRKAHLNGTARRTIAVRLPKEAGGGRGLLIRSLYGTRDAAACWEACIAEVLCKHGFAQGKASPCLFHHPGKSISVLVHGDDFVSLSSPQNCRWLRKVLKSEWDIKERGLLGEDVNEIRILGRILSRTEKGYTLEADPRHAEILIASEGLSEKSNGVVTPGIKADAGDEMSKPLDQDCASAYRSKCMRAAYMALDRPDLQYAVKEAARAMAKPTEADLGMVRRIARYLRHRPRLILEYPWQNTPTNVIGECDSDFAGCKKSRKSTSGFAAFFGTHCLATRSKTQSVIATSSGEAELYALGSATSMCIGIQSVLRDLGTEARVEIHLDASVAKTMASRRGLGKTRHISVQYLWMQDKVTSGDIILRKIRGEDNRSDMMTKHLGMERLENLLRTMSTRFESGTSKAALKAMI